jgi:hypothetical protein
MKLAPVLVDLNTLTRALRCKEQWTRKLEACTSLEKLAEIVPYCIDLSDIGCYLQ